MIILNLERYERIYMNVTTRGFNELSTHHKEKAGNSSGSFIIIDGNSYQVGKGNALFVKGDDIRETNETDSVELRKWSYITNDNKFVLKSYPYNSVWTVARLKG